MTDSTRLVLLWTPRILGVVASLFLAIFALDVFGGAGGFWSVARDLVLHLTPTFALLGIVYVAWNRPLFGAAAFLICAAAYAFVAREHPSWILSIAGPLTVVALAYLLSWGLTREAPRG